MQAWRLPRGHTGYKTSATAPRGVNARPTGRPPMRSRTIAAAIIGLAALGGTAEAQASTLAVDAPCYLENAPISASGTGFTAGGPVNFSFDGQLSASGTADPAGNIAQPLTAPVLPGSTL